jgi:hypothetical protein
MLTASTIRNALWPLKKQRPESPFAHALVNFGPPEINRKYETYSKYPGKEPINICLVNHVAEASAESTDPVPGLEKTFKESEEQCGKSVQQCLNGDCNDPRMVLKITCEWRLIKYKGCFGGKQCADYSFGKCGYWDGELCYRQLDDRKLEQECHEEEDEYGSCCDEFTV